MTTLLRRLRLERGHSARELAAEVGCTHPVILRIEHGGASPRPRTRAALERALGVPFDVLLLDDTKGAPAPSTAAPTGSVAPTTTKART